MITPKDLSGIVLAAGFSRRAAPLNKLLVAVEGRPVVRSVAEAFCGAGLGEVVVVTGHERERIEAALEGLAVRFVYADDSARGMGHSLAAGVRGCRQGTRGLLVSPADLPGLRTRHVKEVVARFCGLAGEKHVVPLSGGKRGHPVALGIWLRERVENLAGDHGAKPLLQEDAECGRLDFLELGDSVICADNDSGSI